MTTEVLQDKDFTPEQVAEQEEADFLQAANGEPEALPELPVDTDEGEALPLAAESEDEFDISTLPPAVVAKLEEKLAAQIEQKLSGRLRNIEGHIGGLKHNLSQLSTAAKAAEEQGADAPTKAQMSEAKQSGAKLAALKEDFPEWAEALEETLSAVNSRPQLDEGAINQRIQSIEENSRAEIQKARQLARLDNAFPDWEQTINSEQYNTWLSNQPHDIQALTSSEKATDALKVLNAYADSTQASNPDLTAQSRQRNRLESAVTPTQGRPATRKKPTTEEEEFLAAYKS